MILEGQNKAPIEIEVRGTVQADPNVNNLPDKKREWITVNYVTNFTISGGGVFDGQGTEAWKSNDCHKKQNCAKLPYVCICLCIHLIDSRRLLKLKLIANV